MRKKTIKVTAEIKKIFDGSEGKVKAAASMNIEDMFVVKNVRLVDGAKGMFMSMPSHKNAEGEYKAICFPITDEFRLQMQGALIAAYEKAVRERVNAAVIGGADETKTDGSEEQASA